MQLLGISHLGSFGLQPTLLAPGGMTLLFAIVLWQFSPKLGRLICRGNDEEGFITGVSFYHLLVITFAGVGLYYCLSAFGGFWTGLYLLSAEHLASLEGQGGTERAYTRLVQDGLTFVAGLFCTLKAPAWARRLSREEDHRKSYR